MLRRANEGLRRRDANVMLDRPTFFDKPEAGVGERFPGSMRTTSA
jgi:hypothetical protein